MPDREFIHSSEDVPAILPYAADAGLQVLSGDPVSSSRPGFLEREEFINANKGVFYLVRPEWVYGELQTMPITGGAYRGKFSISPRVNFSPITLYFQGERTDNGKRRLGSGFASFHQEWLEKPEKNVRSTPPDVQEWFKQLNKQLLTRFFVRAGVHKYYICKHAVNKGDYLPPFDFVPWNSEIRKSWVAA